MSAINVNFQLMVAAIATTTIPPVNRESRVNTGTSRLLYGLNVIVAWPSNLPPDL